MSTPRQGPVGTGNSGVQDDLPAPLVPDEAGEVDQNQVAAQRAQGTAKSSAAVPPGSVLLTSRTVENRPYDIVIDMDNVLVGGRTTSGFVIWYCPVGLMDRLKRHVMVVSGRVMLPPEEEVSAAEEEAEEAKEMTPPKERAPAKERASAKETWPPKGK